MEKLTKAERNALRKIAGKGGRATSGKLTPAQRKAKARTAGLASGKARKKKAGEG